MPTTSPDSIYYADGTTPASIATITAAMATSIQDAFSLRELKSYSWADETARNAQTGMSASEIGYQVDNDTYYIYNNSAWQIWAKAATEYTPSFTAFTSSSSTFTYSIAGSRVFITGTFTCSSTLPTGVITFTTPQDYNIDTTYFDLVRAAIIGTCGIDDASTSNDYDGVVRVVSSSTVSIAVKDVGTTYVRLQSTSASVPMTWASGDNVYVNFSYPVA